LIAREDSLLKNERRIMRIMHAESIPRCEVFPRHPPVSKKPDCILFFFYSQT
jgi:hypothetical protein